MKKKENKILIRFNGKVVGHIDGKIYYTTRTDKHILRIFNSICISEGVIEQIENAGVIKIEFKIVTGDKTEKYRVKLEEVNNCDTYNNRGDVQRLIPVGMLTDFDIKARTLTMDDFIERKSKIGG